MKYTQASNRKIVSDYVRLLNAPMGVLLKEFQAVKGWEKMTLMTMERMAEIIVEARYGKRAVNKALPK